MRKYRISTRKEFVIVISHLHSDHFLGLPGILASFQLLDRKEKLVIIGPNGIDSLVHNLIKINYIQPTYPIEIIPLKPGDKYKGNGYVLETYKAIHDGRAMSFIWKENSRPGKMSDDKIDKLGIPRGPLLGKLQRGEDIEVDGKIIHPSDVMGPSRRGRVVAYTGDSAPNPAFIKKIPFPCDLLVHEGTYPSSQLERALETKHSTMEQAVNMGKMAKVNLLYITHISQRFTKEEFANESKLIENIYPGTKIAKNGMRVIIPLIV